MNPLRQYAWTSRLLHWSMAVALLAMAFVGAIMVTSLADYHRLLTVHRPLGIAILFLAVLRVINRRVKPPPDFLPTVAPVEGRMIIRLERLLYTLMFALPLVGWGMLSAGGYPVVISGAFVLPPILPHGTGLYTVLRTAHTILAYVFFGAFLAHLSCVLFHTVVLRDGLVLRMVPWRARTSEAKGARR